MRCENKKGDKDGSKAVGLSEQKGAVNQDGVVESLGQEKSGMWSGHAQRVGGLRGEIQIPRGGGQGGLAWVDGLSFQKKARPFLLFK